MTRHLYGVVDALDRESCDLNTSRYFSIFSPDHVCWSWFVAWRVLVVACWLWFVGRGNPVVAAALVLVLGVVVVLITVNAVGHPVADGPCGRSRCHHVGCGRSMWQLRESDTG